MGTPPIAEYRNARLTLARQSAPGASSTWSSPIYVDGQLVGRQRAPFHHMIPAVDPGNIDPRKPPAKALRGKWLYGGVWMEHFGHFILETLGGLWPEPDDSFDGIIFHAPYRNPANAWQQEFLRRTGWPAARVRFEWMRKHTKTTDIEHLVVPAVGFELNHAVLGATRDLWDRMMTAGTPEGPVFLSRSKWANLNDGRVLEADAELERRLARRGVRVVSPELLPLAEQLRLMASASAVIGVEGSHLHLAAFASPGTTVISIGTPRFRATAADNQRLICESKQQPLEIVPLYSQGLARDVDATLSAVERALERKVHPLMPPRTAPDEWTTAERGALAAVDRMARHLPAHIKTLQIGRPIDAHPAASNDSAPRAVLSSADHHGYHIVQLYEPGDFGRRYRDLLEALSLVERGGAVLIGGTIPTDWMPLYPTMHPVPEPFASDEGWKMVAAIALFHPELAHRTVLGPWRAQTLVWSNTSEPVASIEGTAAFAQIDALERDDVLAWGIPGWFRASSLDDAFEAWRSGTRTS